jgi:uncharacterized protein YjbI with pentapeptide repeats
MRFLGKLLLICARSSLSCQLEGARERLALALKEEASDQLKYRTSANLRANLEGADLNGANLNRTNLTPEQWNKAKSLEGAVLPDGSVHP